MTDGPELKLCPGMERRGGDEQCSDVGSQELGDVCLVLRRALDHSADL